MDKYTSIPLLKVNDVVQLKTEESDNYYILNNETSITDGFVYYKCKFSNDGSGTAKRIKYYDLRAGFELYHYKIINCGNRCTSNSTESLTKGSSTKVCFAFNPKNSLTVNSFNISTNLILIVYDDLENRRHCILISIIHNNNINTDNNWYYGYYEEGTEEFYKQVDLFYSNYINIINS